MRSSWREQMPRSYNNSIRICLLLSHRLFNCQQQTGRSYPQLFTNISAHWTPTKSGRNWYTLNFNLIANSPLLIPVHQHRQHGPIPLFLSDTQLETYNLFVVHPQDILLILLYMCCGTGIMTVLFRLPSQPIPPHTHNPILNRHRTNQHPTIRHNLNQIHNWAQLRKVLEFFEADLFLDQRGLFSIIVIVVVNIPILWCLGQINLWPKTGINIR